MEFLERLFVELLLVFFSPEQLLSVFGDPRIVAIMIGTLVALSGSVLGSWLFLRKMSLTVGAISRTVLLGIVVTFIIMTRFLDQPANLESPLLIIGAAIAGIFTVYLTELIFRTGIVKEDSALGLVYPLLFAVSVIIISRYVDDVHLDEDTVMLGEIGVSWLDFNEYCFENCDEVEITSEHPAAQMGRHCINCVPEGEFRPYDEGAQFETYCANCGTYPASVSFTRGYTDIAPTLVFVPKAIATTGVIALINLLFVTLFFKELKLATFDSALAATLGRRPTLLMYVLLFLVSVTTVGAFDAVGAVLVVAFFIVPPATAYLLTERVSSMIILSAIIGAAAVYTGYDLARGSFLGIINLSEFLTWIDQNLFSLGGHTSWNTNVASAMVVMAGVFFIIAWIVSPRHGLLAGWLQRRVQIQRPILQ